MLGNYHEKPPGPLILASSPGIRDHWQAVGHSGMPLLHFVLFETSWYQTAESCFHQNDNQHQSLLEPVLLMLSLFRTMNDGSIMNVPTWALVPG